MPPPVTVPPPTCLPDTRSARCADPQLETLSQRWDALFEEALAETNKRPVYDPMAPTDLYTDGSCSDNGRPFAAAGWGVHVYNSDQLGEFFGALPGQVQTNNRAELAAVEAALQLAWDSTHAHCRIFADCNLACMALTNDTTEWSWRKALGVQGWLHRWESNGWRNAAGKRVRHADIWKRILRRYRLFESEPNRCVEIMHVTVHDGNDGNERSDSLVKRGVELRFRLMGLHSSDWFQAALTLYWSNRGS